MERFLLAYSEQPDWDLAISDCLEQLEQLPDEVTLGFVYYTDKHARHSGEILRKLKEETGIGDWVGTIGMAVCCTAREFYDQPAIVILVTDLPKEHYRIFSNPKKLPGLQASDGVRVAVVHGDPRNGQLPNLIHKLPEKIGNGFLTGGLTSSESYHYQIAGDLQEGVISGVIFDDAVPIASGLSQGCSPIGKVRTLTECESNVAVEIDGRPALDVMKEDIGEVLSRDLNRIGGYIFAGFPVAGSDTGNYMVRNLIGIDENSGAIAIGEYLQNNSPIMFCKRDSSTAVVDLTRMVTNLKKRAKGNIKGGLYFSCMGRGQHMFGQLSGEMELIAEILGDVPLAGFYANGEIAGDQLYGYTGVLVLFL